MKIHTDPQRSEAWFSRRQGIPTASQFNRIILDSGRPSGAARTYMRELAYEKLLGKSVQRDLSNVAHIQHGIVSEPLAVEAFEQHTGLKTGPVGFITDDDETMGASPDRIILGANEALEIKCPQGPTMCGYHMHGLDNYKGQLQGQILIGNFRLIHFFAWSNELPPFYVRIEPDPAFQKLLAKYLADFNDELARGIAHIRALGTWPSNAPSMFPDEPDDAA